MLNKVTEYFTREQFFKDRVVDQLRLQIVL